MKGQDVLFSNVRNNPNSKDDWETPKFLFNWAQEELIGREYSTDLAASDDNHLCQFYYTEKDNALIQPWRGYCFLNHPYSLWNKFSKKADEELRVAWSLFEHLDLTILAPARMETKAFARLYEPFMSHMVFIEGRLKFYINGVQSEHSAPFPSVLIRLQSNNTDNLKVVVLSHNNEKVLKVKCL